MGRAYFDKLIKFDSGFEDDAGGSGDGINPNKEDIGNEPPSEGKTIPKEFLNNYKGKTPDELLAEIYKQKTFIGKQSSEIGKLRGSDKLTSDKVSEKLQNLSKQIKDMESSLTEKDPILDEDYKSLSDKLTKMQGNKDELERKYQDLKVEETIYKITAESNNRKLSAEMREYYKKNYGMDLTDDVWNRVLDSASKMSNGATLNKEDVEAGVMKAVGLENYQLLIRQQTEMKTREKIAEATGRYDVLIGGDNLAKNVDLNNMSIAQMQVAISKMSNDKLVKEMKKRKLN